MKLILGSALEVQGDRSKALETTSEAIRLLSTMGDKRLEVAAHLVMARSYFLANDLVAAEQETVYALGLATEYPNLRLSSLADRAQILGVSHLTR